MLTIKNLKTNINKYVLFENVLKDEAGFEPMTYEHLIFQFNRLTSVHT